MESGERFATTGGPPLTGRPAVKARASPHGLFKSQPIIDTEPSADTSADAKDDSSCLILFFPAPGKRSLAAEQKRGSVLRASYLASRSNRDTPD